MKRFLSFLLAATMLTGTGMMVSVSANSNNSISNVKTSNILTPNNPQVKNIIMMIPDGQSVTDTTLARWYKGGEPLAVDEMACGLVRTYSSDAPIADSAQFTCRPAGIHKRTSGGNRKAFKHNRRRKAEFTQAFRLFFVKSSPTPNCTSVPHFSIGTRISKWLYSAKYAAPAV